MTMGQCCYETLLELVVSQIFVAWLTKKNETYLVKRKTNGIWNNTTEISESLLKFMTLLSYD